MITSPPALFSWKPSYMVGHPSIDGEHKRLVDILNRLHASMLEGRSDQKLGTLLDELAQYTRIHFANEERLMQQSGYPGLTSHKKQHEQFAARIAEFQQQFRTGEAAMSIEVLQILKNWLSNHILTLDQEVGKHVGSKRG